MYARCVPVDVLASTGEVAECAQVGSSAFPNGDLCARVRVCAGELPRLFREVVDTEWSMIRLRKGKLGGGDSGIHAPYVFGCCCFLCCCAVLVPPCVVGPCCLKCFAALTLCTLARAC